MTDKSASDRKAKQALATSSGVHAVHDGLSDILYVLLPVLAQFFGLTEFQAGLIRSAQRFGMSLFQIPMGLWAERIGERNLLVAGTVLAGAAWIGIGLAPSFIPLLVICFILGIGGSVQHPLAQAIVSQAYPGQGRRVAIGHYNFWGDAGKLMFAGGTSLWIGLQLPWQAPGFFFGAIALIGAIIILILLNNLGLGSHPDQTQLSKQGPAKPIPKGWGVKHRVGFSTLCTIKFFDSLTRAGFLTFIAFLMIDKGLPKEWAVQALPIIFVGGMLGKLAFGYIAERFGVFRSVITAATTTGSGIFLIIYLPEWSAFTIMALVGVTLNGVSSVLYGTVADYIELNKQARAFGFFYTISSVGGIIAPAAIGFIYDQVSAEIAMSVVGILPLLIIPLCFILRSTERDLAAAKP